MCSYRLFCVGGPWFFLVTVYLIAEYHECIDSLQVFPHPDPLPEGEGINYSCFIPPRAYALGYAHATPLALICRTAVR